MKKIAVSLKSMAELFIEFNLPGGKIEKMTDNGVLIMKGNSGGFWGWDAVIEDLGERGAFIEISE